MEQDGKSRIIAWGEAGAAQIGAGKGRHPATLLLARMPAGPGHDASVSGQRKAASL